MNKSAVNLIGLDKNKSESLVSHLNLLLANYQIHYINTRGFHWNIKGSNFFELHLKFEEIYNDAIIKIDDIAERILTLGSTPLHTYSAYLKTAEIKEVGFVTNGNEALGNVIEAYQILIQLERKILSIAEDANDEGTAAMMSDYIRAQEKSVWMFAAYLGK